MTRWRRRIALGAAFLISAQAFSFFADGVPNTPEGMLVYHAGAGTVDLAMAAVVKKFVTGYIRRDIEAICYASIFVNALGWERYLAWSPPTLYNALIAGLNYGLAIRLLMGDGNVLDIDNWRRLVRRLVPRRQGALAKEAKR